MMFKRITHNIVSRYEVPLVGITKNENKLPCNQD